MTAVPYRMHSDPWVVTCERWHRHGAYIVCPINPGQVDFNIPLRAVHDAAKNLDVFYYWRDFTVSKHKNHNVPGLRQVGDFEVGLSFNTGYIVPMYSEAAQEKIRAGTQVKNDYPTVGFGHSESVAGGRASSGNIGTYSVPSTLTGSGFSTTRTEAMKNQKNVNPYVDDVPIGVQNLYRFLSLADEHRVWYDSENTARNNRVMLIMNTIVFPRLILYGHIAESGIEWEENAESPNSFDVNVRFEITSTYPKLGPQAYSQLVESYLQNLTDAGTADFMEGMADRSTPRDVADSRWSANDLPSESAGDSAQA